MDVRDGGVSNRLDPPRQSGGARSEASRTFLFPGDLGFPRSPMLLSTLLGSCVAVCLFDEARRLGGMNHVMLPCQPEQASAWGRGRYADYAVPRLHAMALRAGCRPPNLVASVFGGAHVAGDLTSAEGLGLFEVGRRNVEAAFLGLRKLGVRVVRHDTGGTAGRKVHMHTGTNEIEVVTHAASAERAERARRLEMFRKRRIRVLLIDDSRTVRAVLRRGIEVADDLEVVGEAADAYEAKERIMELEPDVLCLDIIMPKMDGVSFLRRVMRYRPIPTVIVSTVAKRGTEMHDRARRAGAVEVIDKDELCIYQGTGNMERVLLPALRRAAATVVGLPGQRRAGAD